MYFVFDKLIHKAIIAQAKVFSKSETIIDSPAVPGIINTKRVIPNYATINPPKIEHIVLDNAIFVPLVAATLS